MARKGYGRNSSLVNVSTHADDGTSPVGSNEWNENPKNDGIFGLAKSAQTISGNNNIIVTDSYIEITTADSASGGSNDGIYTLSAGTAVLPVANYGSGTDGASTSIKSYSEGDLIYVVKAAGQGTTTLKHQQGGAGAGKITTLTAGNKELSATVPTILMARTISSVLEWVEYGGGTASDLDTTNFAAATIVTQAEGIANNDNETTLPTSAAVKDYVDTQITAEDLDATTDSGSIDIDLNSEILTVAGGEGIDTSATGTTITVAAEDASATNKGVASFTSGEFTVSSGAVSVDAIAQSKVTGLSTTLGDKAPLAAPALTGNATAVNLTMSGDLIVNGSTTTVNTATLSVEDPLIKLASGNNAADSVDVGFYGLYDASGTDKYAGIVRDASDGKFIAFKDLQTEPTTTVDKTATGYTKAIIIADIEGDVTGNASGLSATLAVGSGGTGSTTESAARTALGVAIGSDVQAFNSATALTTNKISDFAASSSAELRAKISDETGTGLLVFGTAPVITLTNATALPVGGITTTAGTANSSTFLRGDGQWQSAGGGASVDVDFSNTTTLTYRGSLVSDSTHAVGNNIATRALGTARDMYIRKIDDNNEGVFTVIHKNGALVEVQIA